MPCIALKLSEVRPETNYIFSKSMPSERVRQLLSVSTIFDDLSINFTSRMVIEPHLDFPCLFTRQFKALPEQIVWFNV